MSNPSHPKDPRAGLLVATAAQLIPLFLPTATNATHAQQIAISAIEAYAPQTRADFINVARTIAFSIAALALIGQATGQDMTMADKMRVLGRANALNRSADQSERTMMRRRREKPVAEQPDLPPISDEEINAAVAEAMQEYRSTRPQPTSAPERPHVAANPAQPQPATHPAQPQPAPAMSFKASLPAHSAMPPMTASPNHARSAL